MYSDIDIKNITRDILIDNNLFNYPVRIISVASSLGIDVYQESLVDNKSGYIKQNEHGAEITVNRNHSINRKRFTIAHEIGHYVLHLKPDKTFNETFDNISNVQETILNRDNSTNMIEKEANLFAAEILMNEDLVKDAIKRNGKNLSLLSKIFEVSETAMKYRLINLKII